MAASAAGGTPAVSVVMPVRNGGAYFDAAVDSIRTQELRDFELIVIDDGSTDGTTERLTVHARGDPRVIAATSPGKGIVDALMYGIGMSRAALVARMDADDVAKPERLARQLAAMEAAPDLLALGSAAIEIDATGREVGPVDVPTDAVAVRAALRHSNPILHPTVVMRTQAVLAHGGYRKALTHAEDYDLWLRLSAVGDVANLGEPHLLLRRHGGQVSRQRRLDQRAASALARSLAFHGEVRFDTAAGLHAALAAYLERRGADRSPVRPEEARDLELMLRAAWANRLPLGAAATDIAARLGSEARMPGAWKLPFRRWLGV